MKTKFSAVMCVYQGDNAEYFDIAIKSTLDQTCSPTELIIVGDGELSKSHLDVIKKWQKQSKTVTFYQLDENVGVAKASNYGVSKAKTELVAKMDSDDICANDRFEKQLEAFAADPDLCLVGGQISEFADNNPENIASYRRVPTEFEDIKKYARRRSPCNNPTVMFKKSVFEELGGYPDFGRAEDHYLYGKFIAGNHKIANLPDTLVNYRLGTDNMKRRKSWQHTKELVLAHNELRKIGVAKASDVALIAIIRVGTFLAPTAVLKKIYAHLRKK